MGKSLRGILIAGVAISALWAMPANAQRRANRDFDNTPTANQIVDMADARVATLKADLRLTPDEEKNWDGFRSAIHDIAVNRADQMDQMRNGRTVAKGQPSDTTAGNPDVNAPNGNAANADNNADNRAAGQSQPTDTANANAQAQSAPDDIQALRIQADQLNGRADELKKIADAAQPLYASLDDAQRSQLMTFIHTNGAQDQPTQQRRRRYR
jgi:hypothetical protein